MTFTPLTNPEPEQEKEKAPTLTHEGPSEKVQDSVEKLQAGPTAQILTPPSASLVTAKEAGPASQATTGIIEATANQAEEPSLEPALGLSEPAGQRLERVREGNRLRIGRFWFRIPPRPPSPSGELEPEVTQGVPELLCVGQTTSLSPPEQLNVPFLGVSL